MRTRVFFVICTFNALFQVHNLSHAARIEDVPKYETEGRRNQRNIIDDIFSTVSGFFGGAQLATQAPARPLKIMYDDDPIITPPPFPSHDDPHWKPGTTNNNNGGVVQQVFATVSGIASGFFGAVGLNEGGPVHNFDWFRPTPASFPLQQDIRSQIDSSKSVPKGVSKGKDKNPNIQSTNSNDLHFPQMQHDGGIVGEILGQVIGCNEVRKLLGRC